MSDGQRLAEIRARADAATPGPWRTTVFGGRLPERFQVYAPRADNLNVVQAGIGEGNALLIAHCREDVPYLLALVADLQRVVADLCEESDAAAEAMRLRAVLERIAHPKTGRDVWVKLIAEEALRGRDDGKAT
jgi:hypothetical protein